MSILGFGHALLTKRLRIGCIVVVSINIEHAIYRHVFLELLIF